jgi:hypothetical protein
MKVDSIDVTQKLISEKSPIEFDKVKIKVVGQDGDQKLQSKSITPFFPLKDKVLIKAIFEESSLVIKDEKSIRQSNPKYKLIAGIGPEVKGLSIGDSVEVSINSTVEPISFPDNSKSIRSIQSLISSVKLNPIEESKRKAVMIEYYVVHSFSVTGVYG